MAQVDRLTRVNELVKRVLAECIERSTYAAEAGSGSILVSVTAVKTSVDLRHAVVFLSFLGGNEEERQKVFRSIIHCKREFQQALARELAFKHTPVLDFKIDDRIESGDRVLQLFMESEQLNMEHEADGN